MLRSALSWKNAWQIRIVALGFIVLLIGVGSQVLINAVAASTDAVVLKVTVYTTSAKMADGNWTHLGACAVSEAQFSLGTILALYDADGSLDRQCTAEDTNTSLDYGHINLAMPGDAAGAMQWGTRYLSAQILRPGWDQEVPPTSATAPPTNPFPLMYRAKPRSMHFKSDL
ncbi:MAG: hypothetical protein NVSMB33_09080 [Ktedonobacteraceae bacterium]